MKKEEIGLMLEKQRNFLATGKTLDIDYRIGILKKLRSLILSHEEELIDALGREIAPANVQATLLEFTAMSLCDAIERECSTAQELYVCGGGAHNGTLMQRIHARLPKIQVATTAALGIDPDWVEALAFAWLARQTLHHAPGNLPSVTGARGARILGAIYPA